MEKNRSVRELILDIFRWEPDRPTIDEFEVARVARKQSSMNGTKTVPTYRFRTTRSTVRVESGGQLSQKRRKDRAGQRQPFLSSQSSNEARQDPTDTSFRAVH